MQYRTFKQTGWRVSEIGLGCWQLGGDCWGDLDDVSAYQILQSSVDSGVNFFDTADVYGGGRSEEFLGKFIKECPESIHVVTKLGRQAHVFPDQFTTENLRGCTEDSLRRLGVETLDLTQLHCLPMEALQEGNAFDIMRDLKKEGKILNWGVSVESMEEALICIEQEGCVSLQIIFNIFRQKPIEALFEKAKLKGVSIIVRLPLASGLLSGKMEQNHVFADNDHRNFNCDGQLFNVGETFAGLPYSKGVELASKIKEILPTGIPVSQSSLRWILDHDAVTVVIPGASKVEQACSNAASSDLKPLSESVHQELKSFYHSNVEEHIRGPY
jgi:aryl-alcohol dehydrogenase-like predicted oxidoreductase